MPITQSQPPNGPLVDPKTGEITFEWLQWFTNRRGVEFYPFIDLTADYPALKRSLAILQARLADDSAYTDLEVLDEAYGSSWNGSVEVPTKNALYDYLNALPTLAFGTFTPTATITANVDSATPRLARYIRLGSIVFVAGQVDINPTVAGGTLTQLEISVPINSAFSSSFQLSGVANAMTNASEVAALNAQSVNNAYIQFYAQSASTELFQYVYGYIIV